jgi:type II secretory pathway pseudopilin PulG
VRRTLNEEGMALIMALAVLVVLGILGMVITTYTTSGQKTASRSSAGVSAYSFAEAGINNAMSLLAKPTNAMGGVGVDLLPRTTKYYDRGSVTWQGTWVPAPSNTWKIKSTGTIPNPINGSPPVTRTITVSVKVRPKTMQPTNNPAWNYIIATRTSTPKGCDQSLNNSVNIQSPMYVLGNLCLNTPSQITGGPLQVHGSVTLDVNTNIGSSGAPLNEIHVKNGCSYKTGAYVSPCTPTQKVWGAADANPITLDLPTADFASWYVNSAPGPRQACTTQSGTVPIFDNNTTWDSPMGSVPGVFNLTPPSSDYSCVVQGGNGTVYGQLSWNHTTKILTIAGTVFIDGSVTVTYGFSNVPIKYVGTGTIYVGGTFLFSNTLLCADINATNDGCDFPKWDPNRTFLVIVANGSGGQVPVGDSIQIVSSDFEGGLFATNTIELDTHSLTEGPMFAANVIMDNTVYARTWPLVTVPIGMPGTIVTDAPPDAPGDYSG